jgi:hypothetical protein
MVMNEFPLPHALVLVGVMPAQRDLEIARMLGWYRIPLKSAPKIVDVDYLAFYQTAAFGEEHRWRIEYLAEVLGHELVIRRELFKDEIEHPRANEEYYKISIGALMQLETPICARNWHRITFLYSTGYLFQRARTIDDLVVRSEDRMGLWQSLKERAQTYQGSDPGKRMELEIDPSVLLMLGDLGEFQT